MTLFTAQQTSTQPAAGKPDARVRCRWVERTARAFLVVLTLIFWPEPPMAAQLADGSGSFDYSFVSGGAKRTITVWYHRPAVAGADAPIVFVMHGQARNAMTYRKYWIPFAEKKAFVLLTPEFSRQEFPQEWHYNLGNKTSEDGKPYPEAQWGFTAIEDIFDAVRKANGFTRPNYDIYGHSAGGQFVHRLVTFKPAARYRVAVAANAGWYSMPDFAIAYPYGLGGAGATRDQLARVLGRRLVVLLGDRDLDPDHASLRRTLEAMAQGENRYTRGHAYFERAQRAADELKTPFAWTLRTAPGVPHSNARMAPHAAAFVGGSD